MVAWFTIEAIVGELTEVKIRFPRIHDLRIIILESVSVVRRMRCRSKSSFRGGGGKRVCEKNREQLRWRKREREREIKDGMVCL